MNYNLFMIQLKLAQIARQEREKRLQYVASIKNGSK